MVQDRYTEKWLVVLSYLHLKSKYIEEVVCCTKLFALEKLSALEKQYIKEVASYTKLSALEKQYIKEVASFTKLSALEKQYSETPQ